MFSTLLTSLGIGGAAAGIASAAAILGPGLVAGGPIGLVIAWLGAKAASKTTKIVAILGGIAIIVASAVAITVRIEHLEQAARALAIVKGELAHERAMRAAIEAMLGCSGRPIAAERELGACILAQRGDALEQQKARLEADRAQAVAEQKRLDEQERKDSGEQAAEVAAIVASPVGDDGPVPKVLRDAWARERARRGIK